MLAGCQCKNITDYHAAMVRQGTTELMIVMELMSCSVADLVRMGAVAFMHVWECCLGHTYHAPVMH